MLTYSWLMSLRKKLTSRTRTFAGSRRQNNRWQPLAVERLEERALLATVTDLGGTTLNLSLGANENLAIVSNGSSYTVSSNQSFTDGGVSDAGDFSAFGGTSLTVQATGLTRYSAFNVTDTNGASANTTVTFNTSGANVYSDTFNVALTNAAAGAITFNGSSTFSGSNALSAATTRNISLPKNPSKNNSVGWDKLASSAGPPISLSWMALFIGWWAGAAKRRWSHPTKRDVVLGQVLTSLPPR